MSQVFSCLPFNEFIKMVAIATTSSQTNQALLVTKPIKLTTVTPLLYSKQMSPKFTCSRHVMIVSGYHGDARPGHMVTGLGDKCLRVVKYGAYCAGRPP